MQAFSCVVETSRPIARQKTFARAPGNGIKARLVIKKSLLRGFGGKSSETTVGQRDRFLRNVITDDRRSCIQQNCSASVEPHKAVVELLPLAMICATRSK